MDGAGRLARSVRSLRPQADLKAVAIGAAVLMRGLLGFGRARPTPVVDREPRSRLVAMIERLANAIGFRITAVAVNGRKQLTQDEVLAIGGVSGRSSLLFLDATAVRERLKANPWIADATVLKLYPGHLQIDLVERTPFALWQRDGRLSVIADDGAVLEPYVSHRFVSLPLVVGSGAETHARDFLALLARYPQVNAVTKAAIFVGERRWNLRLKDGLDIRLPEADAGNALAALSKLDKEDHLFSRDIVAVDMRLPDRLTVQLSDDAAKARDEQFRKSRKKAGDA